MPFIRGLSMTAGMIISLGPQNSFLIKHGLFKNPKTLHIAAIFIVIDIILITIGALGVGSIISQSFYLRIGMTIFAASFFIYYGIASLLSSRQGKVATDEPKLDRNIYLTAVILSVANPAVLLDTIVIVGGLASRYQTITDRVFFSIGAITASTVWFMVLSAMALWASRFVENSNTWRIVELVIGIFMIGLGVFLLYDLYIVEF